MDALLAECSGYENFSILSVGSGSGLFEVPMLRRLLAAGKRVARFTGVDIDEDANQLLRAALDDEFGNLLDFEIVSDSFGAFDPKVRAEIILYNHVFEYIREGHLDWMEKSLRMLAEGGKLLLFSPIQGGINAIYEDNMSEHFDYAPYYSADIEKMLLDAGISFTKESIRGECDISLLDEVHSDTDAMKLLSFLTQVDCRKIPADQIAEQVKYFQSLRGNGSALIPHPTDFFILTTQ